MGVITPQSKVFVMPPLDNLEFVKECFPDNDAADADVGVCTILSPCVDNENISMPATPSPTTVRCFPEETTSSKSPSLVKFHDTVDVCYIPHHKEYSSEEVAWMWNSQSDYARFRQDIYETVRLLRKSQEKHHSSLMDDVNYTSRGIRRSWTSPMSANDLATKLRRRKRRRERRRLLLSLRNNPGNIKSKDRSTNVGNVEKPPVLSRESQAPSSSAMTDDSADSSASSKEYTQESHLPKFETRDDESYSFETSQFGCEKHHRHYHEHQGSQCFSYFAAPSQGMVHHEAVMYPSSSSASRTYDYYYQHGHHGQHQGHFAEQFDGYWIASPSHPYNRHGYSYGDYYRPTYYYHDHQYHG